MDRCLISCVSGKYIRENFDRVDYGTNFGDRETEDESDFRETKGMLRKLWSDDKEC